MAMVRPAGSAIPSLGPEPPRVEDRGAALAVGETAGCIGGTHDGRADPAGLFRAFPARIPGMVRLGATSASVALRPLGAPPLRHFRPAAGARGAWAALAGLAILGVLGFGAGASGAGGTAAVSARPDPPIAAAATGPGAGRAEAALGEAAPEDAAALQPLAWAELQGRIIEVSEAVKPAVVHVEAIVRHNDRRRAVTGSGLVVDPSGIILTNEHVIEKAEKVTVTVPGRRGEIPATVLGSDKQTDIGVLRIRPDAPLVAAPLGDSDAVRVGQWVLAVGNPYGLDGTVSFGIVSAKGRNLEVPHLLNEFIQTDAMIDHGSSGGPLVDLEGRVVGINSRGQGRGIGFTIPIATALEVMEQIRDGDGAVQRGWLGVTVQPLDRELAAYFGMPETTGVVVNSVSRDSPAEAAGLRAGDVITAVDATPVEAERTEDLRGFQRQVASLAPGREVALSVLREGEPRRLAAVLGEQPRVVPDEARSEVGFHAQEITEHLVRSHRLATREGAFVSFVERGSPAAEAGLARGDVIEAVDGKTVADLAGLRRSLDAAEDRERFLLVTRRGDETLFLLVSPRLPSREDEPDDPPLPARDPPE